MRLLHTADWHAGRSLHGQDRTSEVRAALQEIADIAKDRAVDLILVAGDLYDSKNPSADAEAAVYEFFLDTGRAGIPSVVIAGNHDSPSRLDAVAHLLKLSSVHAVGHARVAGQGGVLELPIGGELARVAALPFVSERRLVKVQELLETDPGQWLARYQEGMRKLIHNLCGGFSADAVNLLMMHATMDGATLSNSEYQFHSTATYALGADLLPDTASYVALGHIHKSQAVKGYPEHAGRYAGSILQLDFGEQGDEKAVFVVEAKPGRPTETLERVPLTAGKPLKRVSLEPDALDRRAEELERFPGWLKIVLKLDTPRPGLKERVRQSFPNALVVETELAGGALPEPEAVAQGADLDLLEAYERYAQTKRGQPLSDALRDAFRDLLHELDAPEEAEVTP